MVKPMCVGHGSDLIPKGVKLPKAEKKKITVAVTLLRKTVKNG